MAPVIFNNCPSFPSEFHQALFKKQRATTDTTLPFLLYLLGFSLPQFEMVHLPSHSSKHGTPHQIHLQVEITNTASVFYWLVWLSGHLTPTLMKQWRPGVQGLHPPHLVPHNPWGGCNERESSSCQTSAGGKWKVPLLLNPFQEQDLSLEGYTHITIYYVWLDTSNVNENI